MTTEIRFEKKILQGIPIGKPNAFPPFRNAPPPNIDSRVEESDGLRLGYGMVPNILPHTSQDVYGTEMEEMQLDSVVLENEFLKARFLPGTGGRLWSLFDKEKQRDLVVENPVFKPRNFAVRNAWLSGGVEWNIGSRGHDAYTCSPLFTAVTEDEDGTPVLRFYEFSRVRSMVYQMDFFLPANSRFLFARMRLENTNSREIPMYWWSNIAVEERDKQRIIVPAMTTFTNTYISETQHALAKLSMPVCNGYDCTCPANYPTSKDQFFNVLDSERKFISSLYEDGYGLIQTSTDRLKGRKLFVWGRSAGGLLWQKRLTSPDGLPYVEIQAGLCKTQLEHVPMPAGAVWEWMEAYGAMQADPNAVFGEWNGAVADVSERLEKSLPRKKMEELLDRTRASFATKKAQLISNGSGWGALENLRREKSGATPLPSHLDFGTATKEQADWIALLDKGQLPQHDGTEDILSYMVQEEWFERIKAATEQSEATWNAWFHLGVNYFYRKQWAEAETAFQNARALSSNCWTLYGLGNLYRMQGDFAKSAEYMLQAASLRKEDTPFVKEAFRSLAEAGEFGQIIATYEQLPEFVKDMPQIRFLYAEAIAKQGNLDLAEKMLLEFIKVDIPDIREGEISLAGLYIYIQQAKAKLAGKELTEAEIEVPAELDLRMNVKTVKK